MKQRAATFAKTRHYRTLKINLPVELHEHLHGLQLLTLRREREALAHEFIGKILDGVGQKFERAACPRVDVPATAAAHTSSGSGRGD